MGKLGRLQKSRARLGVPHAGKTATLSDMTGEDKLGRDMAEAAYEVDKRDELGKQHGYELDKDLSDNRTAVFHNKDKGRSYIGFRGTADSKDLYTDLLDPRGNILKGTQNKNPQFQNDLKMYDAVQKKYGGSTAVSGHSLGGQRARHVSKHRGAQGQGFNVGTGLDKGMLVDKLKCSNPIKSMRPKYCDKFTSHHVSGDLLSATNRFGYGKQKNYKFKNPGKAHFLTNFFPS